MEKKKTLSLIATRSQGKGTSDEHLVLLNRPSYITAAAIPATPTT
jgi:hypothetical protein